MKNSHRIVLFVLLFLFIGNVKANTCIPSGTTITLSRQAQVDSFRINFPDCDVVDGALVISGNNIINLNGLNDLRYIRNLEIKNNSSLSDLVGLNNLISSETINIDSNFYLTSLQGLNSLIECQNMYIRHNSMLQNLVGLDKLETINTTLLLRENNSMKDLQGIFNIKSIGILSIINNDSILNLNGLFTLRNISTVQIDNNKSILNLNGLNNITKLEDYSFIGYNANLQSLNGLDNLDSTEMLGIISNPKLENIYALHNLKKVGNLLYITYNELLRNISGLESLTYAYHVSIIGNDLLEDLNGLKRLSEVHSINIAENPSIQNLNGLENVKNVQSFINIFDNFSLTSLQGLKEDIVIKNRFEVHGNPKLSCCILAKTIISNNPSINTNIYANDIGCSSVPEVMALTPTSTCCVTTYKNDTITICEGLSYKVGIHNYNTTGIYYDTIQISAGCDSIIITNLTVRPKSYQIQTKNFCVGQSFTLNNGSVITTNGTYKDTLQTIFGCDSIIEYHLSFFSNITTNQNPIICKGKTYTLPKGNVVSVAGIYRDTLQASFGCDSIITTNLTVTNPIPFNNNVTICSGKTFIRPNGNIVSTTGIYYDTIKAPNTCDSIVITNLTVTPYLQSTQISSVCRGKSFTLPSGRSVQQSGIFKDTIKNNNGCDSIITTNLTVTNPIPFINAVSICEGKNYTLPNGKIVNTAGTYTDTLKQNNTCDSIVVTNLTVFPNTFNVALPTVDTIEAGSSMELIPIYTNDSATTWLWTPTYNLNCTTCERPIASPFITTTYIVNASANNGCEDSAQTTIVVRNLEVHIPTAFSPNNDGVNDELKVFANNPKYFHLSIFNRWGELVFESTDINHQWNGTYKGNECLMDNYSYVLDVVMQNDIKHYKKGSILLLR